MSIAFDSNINRIPIQSTMWIHSERFNNGGWTTNLPVVQEEDSSTSSSIGNDSDAAVGGGGDSGDEEVESKGKGLMNELNDIEQVLPIKRGISTFYAGKSKSFDSLGDATSVESIRDIVKPEDAYTRKRKNMIAHNVLFDKNYRSDTENGILSKRLASSSRSCCLSLGPNINKKMVENSNSNASKPGVSLPPLPRNIKKRPVIESSSGSSSPRLYSSPWRSLSLSDLQHVSGATPSLVSNERDNKEEN